MPGGIRECNNHCEFCFIRGLPSGLRPTLYVFDDDYRYSFLWGNFLTLTNLEEADWARIGYQRLSPLKLLTLLINLAVVVYLLLAKRLFGLRGGARAEAAERERDTGWPALQRSTPTAAPAATTPAPTAR